MAAGKRPLPSTQTGESKAPHARLAGMRSPERGVASVKTHLSQGGELAPGLRMHIFDPYQLNL